MVIDTIQQSALLAMAAKHDEALMREAIREMRAAGLVNKTGGPFGAVSGQKRRDRGLGREQRDQRS